MSPDHPRQRTPQFNLVVPDSTFLDEIEEWRAKQRPVPSRSAAIIELCRRAMMAETLKECEKSHE